jgi:hypothetical protein
MDPPFRPTSSASHGSGLTGRPSQGDVQESTPGGCLQSDSLNLVGSKIQQRDPDTRYFQENPSWYTETVTYQRTEAPIGGYISNSINLGFYQGTVFIQPIQELMVGESSSGSQSRTQQFECDGRSSDLPDFGENPYDSRNRNTTGPSASLTGATMTSNHPAYHFEQSQRYNTCLGSPSRLGNEQIFGNFRHPTSNDSAPEHSSRPFMGGIKGKSTDSHHPLLASTD